MASEGALRRRLALALVALSLAVAGLLPLTLGLTDGYVQEAVVDDLMSRQLDMLVQGDALPLQVETGLATLRYYRPAVSDADELPPALRSLRSGTHHDLRIDQRQFHVQVRDIAPGDRVYLSYDVTLIESRERLMLGMLLLLVALVTLLVWLFARRMVDRMLAPLSQLVAQIRALKPTQRGQHLALASRDSELGVIADAFNAYMTQLDALVEREKAFAAAANHELRTPLAVIQASASLLRDMPQVPERARARLTQAVREACDNLDALLTLSQPQASPAKEELRLDLLLPAVAQAYLESAASRSPLRWVVEGAAPLTAARGVVTVIFTNLLRNALRAANGEPVTIEIARHHVAVRDAGPGIAPRDLPHIFEPHYQGPGGGTGMGLYISRTLAQQDGWTLEVANQASGGVRAIWRF